MKKFFEILLFPFAWLARLKIAQKIEEVFKKHSYLVYILALLITMIYVFIVYMYPTLRG